MVLTTKNTCIARGKVADHQVLSVAARHKLIKAWVKCLAQHVNKTFET